MRYYGLHATCKAKKVQGVLTALMVALGRLIKGTYRIAARQTSRERVLASTGRDPLRCARCGGEMMRWQVWHPRYGVVYDEVQAIKRGRYGLCRGSPPGSWSGRDWGKGHDPARAGRTGGVRTPWGKRLTRQRREESAQRALSSKDLNHSVVYDE